MHTWVLVLLQIVLYFFLAFIFQYLLKKTLEKFAQKRPAYIPLCIEALYPILPLFLYSYTTLLIIAEVFDLADIQDLSWVDTLQKLFITLTIASILLKFKNLYENSHQAQLLKKNAEQRALNSALYKLLTIFLFLVTTLIVLEILHVPITTLIAFGGLGGLAISWAGKDVIANFFGGLMIFVNRHLSPGDMIKSPNKNFEGIIEHIGWYQTRLRTYERSVIFVPNALMTDAIVENHSRRYNRRMLLSLTLRYQDLPRIESLCSHLKQQLIDHPDVDTKQLLLVNLKEFAAYSVNIEVYCFLKPIDYVTFSQQRQNLLLLMQQTVHDFGCDFAYPTQTLYGEWNTATHQEEKIESV